MISKYKFMIFGLVVLLLTSQMNRTAANTTINYNVTIDLKDNYPTVTFQYHSYPDFKVTKNNLLLLAVNPRTSQIVGSCIFPSLISNCQLSTNQSSEVYLVVGMRIDQKYGQTYNAKAAYLILDNLTGKYDSSVSIDDILSYISPKIDKYTVRRHLDMLGYIDPKSRLYIEYGKFYDDKTGIYDLTTFNTILTFSVQPLNDGYSRVPIVNRELGIYVQLTENDAPEEPKQGIIFNLTSKSLISWINSIKYSSVTVPKPDSELVYGTMYKKPNPKSNVNFILNISHGKVMFLKYTNEFVPPQRYYVSPFYTASWTGMHTSIGFPLVIDKKYYLFTSVPEAFPDKNNINGGYFIQTSTTFDLYVYATPTEYEVYVLDQPTWKVILVDSGNKVKMYTFSKSSINEITHKENTPKCTTSTVTITKTNTMTKTKTVTTTTTKTTTKTKTESAETKFPTCGPGILLVFALIPLILYKKLE